MAYEEFGRHMAKEVGCLGGIEANTVTGKRIHSAIAYVSSAEFERICA